MGAIAAAGCDDKLRWRCWSLSFVHVSCLSITSSNRNGVFESYLDVISDVISQGAKRPTPTQSTCLYYYHDNEASKCDVIFHRIGRIRFMTWCFEHQRENVVYCRESCIVGLLAIWVLNELAALAPQAFSQTARFFPCHEIDDNSQAGNEFDDSSPEKSSDFSSDCNYHECGFRNRSQEA
jgi:hypothetical protein